MCARISKILLACLIAACVSAVDLQVARADSNLSEEDCDQILRDPTAVEPAKRACREFLLRKAHLGPKLRKAAVAKPIATVRRMLNVDATTQPNEPTEGGLMTRTEWVGFKAPAAERIVIHTFGSEIREGDGVFDTVLAVYRGTWFDNFTRLAGNDNTPVPGIGGKHSLVQFNAAMGAEYRVQVGSRNQAEGEISLNMFRFPPTGGLAAFLIQQGGIPSNGRDYSCVDSITCPSAKFIVYNASDKTLNVTSSTTLGPGITNPSAFALKPRKLKVVEFKFKSNFSDAVRTQVGDFVFTGRVEDKIVTKAANRALIVVRPGSRIDNMVRAEASPTIRTGFIHEPLSFTAKLINTSGSTAIGCHFRSVNGELKASFYEIDPKNESRLGDDDTPRNIAAGQSRTFKVTIASRGTYDADHFDPDVIGDCANNARTESPLRGGFDISTSAHYAHLPSLNVSLSEPSNGVLKVPATGSAYYTFRIKNTKTSAKLDVLAAYVKPFDDPPNSNYLVQICRTNLSTGKCIGKYASFVTYKATKDTVFGFSVRVKGPQVATPFDPDKRRVVVNFKLAKAPYFHIAAPSIAVKGP